MKEIWKLLTFLNPSTYFIAKVLGGEAEEGADEAIYSLIIGLLIVAIVGGAILAIVALLGVF